MRADIYIALKGYAESRSKAKNLIESAGLKIDGMTVTKPSYEIDAETGHMVEIIKKDKFVSRGGLKLEYAIDNFGLDVSNFTAVDIGASTGGFSDCLLQKGVKKIYALDSGQGQLHEKIRNDTRVVPIEKFNARNMEFKDIGEYADIAVMDVSFISQTCIIPCITKILKTDGYLVSLIKPQFEAGKAAVGKNGIVKSRKDRFFAIKRVLTCALENGFECLKLFVSPIQGGDGNVEFLAVFRYGKESASAVPDETIRSVVEN